MHDLVITFVTETALPNSETKVADIDPLPDPVIDRDKNKNTSSRPLKRKMKLKRPARVEVDNPQPLKRAKATVPKPLPLIVTLGAPSTNLVRDQVPISFNVPVVDRTVVVSLEEATSDVEHPTKERQVASKKRKAVQSREGESTEVLEEVGNNGLHPLFMYPNPRVVASGNEGNDTSI